MVSVVSFFFQVTPRLVVIQLLADCICALMLSRIVCRAKQCLDFTSTLHFWHILAVILYDKIPFQASFWLLQVFSLVISTVLSEYICLKLETREIFLSTNSKYEV